MTREGIAVIAMLLACSPIHGQPGDVKIAYLPALEYGPNLWSVITMTNLGDWNADVTLEAFRSDGASLPESSKLTIGPRSSTEIRIESGRGGYLQSAWARVTGRNVSVKCVIEALDGNSIHSTPRLPEPADFTYFRFTARADEVRGSTLYVLNTEDAESSARTCYAASIEVSCSPGSTRSVPANGSIAISVDVMIPDPFVIVEFPAKTKMIALYLNETSGEVREFSAKSTISFGDVK